MTEAIIKADHCSRGFGGTTVLSDVSFSIGPGSVFGLVGLNGAGKTTLIRLLLGLLKPDAGTINLLGHTPWKHESSLYKNMGIVLEHDGFSGNLSFLQNIEFYSRAKGQDHHALAAYLNEYWTGSDIMSSTKRVKHFSRGQRMQAALCRAFAGWPSVCVFDEPTVALDVKACDHFASLVRVARSQGAAVLISSHQLSAIEELCDTVGILRNGAIMMLDTGAAVRNRWRIDTDPSPDVGALITGATGGAADFSNGAWRFSVQDPSHQVPAIVAALSAGGHAIREVRPDSDGLIEEIRKIYS